MAKKPKSKTTKTDVNFESMSKIPSNAPSPIIMGTLDSAIENALKPLMMKTNLVSRALTQLAGQFSGETARFTMESFGKVVDLVFDAIVNLNFDSYRRAHVDRSTSLSIVLYFLENVKPHMHSEEDGGNEELVSFAEDIGCPVTEIFPLYREVQGFSSVARFIIDEIYKKYTTKSWQEARKKVKYSGQYLDVTHVYANLLLGIQQGLDRCCVDKGNLTSSIVNFQRVWATHKNYGAIYGVAYNMPPSATLQSANMEEHEYVNFAAGLEEVSEEYQAVYDSHTPTTSPVLSGLSKIEGTALSLLATDLLPALTEGEVKLLRSGRRMNLVTY